jgi:hypothetical protein
LSSILIELRGTQCRGRSVLLATRYPLGIVGHDRPEFAAAPVKLHLLQRKATRLDIVDHTGIELAPVDELLDQHGIAVAVYDPAHGAAKFFDSLAH